MPGKGGPRRGKKGRGGKLPEYDRFGPCQACYAVVGSLDEYWLPLDEPAKLEYNLEDHCATKNAEYEIVQPPRGGSPLVQGPGLPNLKERMGDDIRPADEKLI